MKEKIRKKTKRPQTEDMIFTEEDFEDVSEETKGNSPKHRKRSRRTSGGFPARKAGIIAGGVIGVLVLLYLGISVFFMSHFYINTTINGKDFSGRSASSVEAYIKEQVKDYKLTIKEQDSKSDVIKGSDISLQYKDPYQSNAYQVFLSITVQSLSFHNPSYLSRQYSFYFFA